MILFIKQSKISKLFNKIDTYTKSHQTLEKERKIKALTIRNQNLTKENNNLKIYLKAIKTFLKNYYKLAINLLKKPLQLKLKIIMIIMILI